ncbi:MAG TPA: extracellular solute-binding protein [Bacillota bacterium]|nr:extracellular solute-binding protein [Bacillota bacterium]
MKRITLVIGLVLILALGVLPGAFAATQTQVTVMYNSNEFPPEMVKAFETENPDLKIVKLETDTARFMAMNAAGNPPDIMRCNSNWIPYLVTHKMALDLTPYFKKSKYLNEKDFLPIANDYKYKGKYYGFVKDWSPVLIGYYNKDAFQEAGIPFPSATEPISFKQMADIARKLQKTEGDRIIRRGLAFWPMDINSQLQLSLTSCGQNLYSKDGSQIILTKNPKAKEICKFWFDLAKEKVIPSPISPSETWEGSLFPGGRIGMIFYGYWYGAMCEGEQTKGKVGVIAAPVWDPKLTRVSPSFNIVGGFISSKTKNPDAAFRVFEWFFGGAPAKERASSGWGVPAQKSLLGLVATDTPLGKERQQNLDVEMKYVKICDATPYILPDIYDNSMRKNFELALKGEITFDKFLVNVENEVNKAISDSRASMK